VAPVRGLVGAMPVVLEWSRWARVPGRTYDGLVATMQQLTSICGSFEARVLAARLYDEGIDAELRGALDSPYGFTVGDMARVDVYVPIDQAEDAQLVLLANEVDAATELPEPRGGRRPITWPCWIVLAASVAAALSPMMHSVTH
jgi:hypothetical protein